MMDINHRTDGSSFITFDFETANYDYASICQIGIAVVESGQVVKTFTELVNPESDFFAANIAVHGITPEQVEYSPAFAEIMSVFAPMFQNNTAISHSAFDRIAINRACDRYSIPSPLASWADSIRIVRRTWPEQFGQKGYGLRNVADTFGIKFAHHDAGEDARAAALIMLKAMEYSGQTLAEIIESSSAKLARHKDSIRFEGDPDGPVTGESVVFTGRLAIPRKEAATLAASAGISVAPSVTKQTTLLVVGEQDLGVLAGHEKSSKHRKAEELIASGQKIRIISDAEFASLIDTD